MMIQQHMHQVLPRSHHRIRRWQTAIYITGPVALALCAIPLRLLVEEIRAFRQFFRGRHTRQDAGKRGPGEVGVILDFRG